MSKINQKLNQGFDSSKKNQEKPKAKFRFNYDEKENEFVEVETEILKDVSITVGVSLIIATILGVSFKVSYLNYLGSVSLYLFVAAGFLLLYASVSSLCSESPSLQYLSNWGDQDKVKIRTSSNLKTYLFASLAVFALSFLINYINKFINI